jgi:hypothetical protein
MRWLVAMGQLGCPLRVEAVKKHRIVTGAEN